MRAGSDDVKYNKPSGRRGEKDAKNLKRRRLLNSVLRGLSVTAVCLVVILSLYRWRSGQITTWINSAENKVEDSLVDA